ncbi:MAG TPA: alcohol dehydrogenase catalytic domain-containing protein [Candidatus Sulfotelmatobacter sp.]|nr:alcohol dehydrogenase catalytic domain-containing protein [Candidatus Sulfotelmatobacter sp.]
MKAVVKTAPGPGNLAYTDFPEPTATPGHVLIEVQAAGLCGTDLGLYGWADSTVKQFKPKLPLVMGHEFAGVVVELGPGAAGFRVGDRVTANPIMYCGQCYYCRAGRQSICDDRPILGLGLNGCFAKLVAVRRENVYAVPPEVPFETAALSEILCVVLHALDRVPVGPGDTVAVVGPGPLGTLILLGARAAGASRLVMTGLRADGDRLKVAERLGAHTIMVDETDPAQAVRDVTRGLGADVVFECAGHPRAVPQALTLVRKGGKIGVLGMGHGDSSFDTAALAFGEVELIGIRAYDPKIWHRSYDVLAARQFPLDAVISHRLPLAEAARGIELMQSKQGLKIMFTPDWS